MQAIVDDSEFDCADSDVQSLVDTQKQQYEQYASYFGMSLDDFLSNNGMTDEKLEENARFQISCTLAIDAIGKAENMTVSDEEYQSGLEELANQYGAESGEAFEEQYGKEDVENSILDDKIMEMCIRDRAGAGRASDGDSPGRSAGRKPDADPGGHKKA